MMSPKDVLNIAEAGKAAGDRNRVETALLWLDVYFDRLLTPGEELIHSSAFGGGDLLTKEAKLFMLEQALLDDGGGDQPGGEELPENIERLRAA